MTTVNKANSVILDTIVVHTYILLLYIHTFADAGEVTLVLMSSP